MKRDKPSGSRSSDLTTVHVNAAAIDIGATMHMAAVGADRSSEPVRSFGTFTADLCRLADWFAECGVKTVVMESTGVYWIPIFELLDERGFEVFLVNARDAKHVPGRKTDVSDAQWLQRLHSHGLLRASFRPKGEIAELRAYLRQRERLLDYAASHIQHMQKALTEMNLQLHHVVSDVTGATGLRIIRAIVAGERDPAVLAMLRDTRCHADAETIQKALGGHYRSEHLFALEQALGLYEAYQERAQACDVRIEAVLKALSTLRDRQTVPMPPPRQRGSRQSNGPGFDVRGALYGLLGKDLTQIHGMGALSRAQADRRMRRRPLSMADGKALHVPALSGSQQQDLRRQGSVVTDTTLGQQSGGAVATGRDNHRSNRHRPGSLLPSPFNPYRQGEGRHRDRSQDRGAVLQCCPPRDGLRRSRSFVLRGTLSGPGHRQSAAAG